MSFEKRHELLKVADVYVAAVSRYLRGCPNTTGALHGLERTFAYRGEREWATFIFFDATPEIRSDLGM